MLLHPENEMIKANDEFGRLHFDCDLRLWQDKQLELEKRRLIKVTTAIQLYYIRRGKTTSSFFSKSCQHCNTRCI